jgi:hypothetical protein
MVRPDCRLRWSRVGPPNLRLLPERLRHSVHRRMLPILHLEPVLRPASLIGPVTPFRNRAL